MADTTIELKNFRGIAPSVAAPIIDNSLFEEMVNFYISESESELKVREGMWQYADVSAGSASPTKCLMIFNHSDRRSFIINLRADNNIDVYSNTVYDPASSRVSNSYSGGVSVNKWAVQYGDLVYLLTAAGVTSFEPLTNTKTVMSAVSGGLYYGIIFKDRLFALSLSNGNRLYYSDIANIGTISGTSFIDIGVGDGQVLTGLAPLPGNRLLILKDRSSYILNLSNNDVDNWDLTLLPSAVGCNSPTSVAFSSGWVYFIGAEGVCRTDGVTVQTLSPPISNVFLGREDQGGSAGNKVSIGLDFAASTADYGGVWQDHYIFTLVEKPDTLFLYNFKHNAWYLWKHSLGCRLGMIIPDNISSNFTGITGGAIGKVFGIKLASVTGSNRYILSYGQHGDPAYTQSITGFDLPTPYKDAMRLNYTPPITQSEMWSYQAHFITKPLSMDIYDRWKRFKNIVLTTVGKADFTVSYAADDGAYSSNFNASSPYTGVSVLKYKCSVFARFFKIKVVVTPDNFDSGANYIRPISIISLKLTAAIKGPTRNILESS